jgi:hypothetical protein
MFPKVVLGGPFSFDAWFTSRIRTTAATTIVAEPQNHHLS